MDCETIVQHLNIRNRRKRKKQSFIVIHSIADNINKHRFKDDSIWQALSPDRNTSQNVPDYGLVY